MPAGLGNDVLFRAVQSECNHRVMPEFMTMRDEPTRKSREGHLLAGCKLVDDEDVPTDDITLVEKGRLVGLPTSRGPTKELNHAPPTSGP